MPQHKSSIKRMRQDAKRRLHNRQLRSQMRTLIKNVLRQEEKEAAEQQLQRAVSYLDKMALRGIIHKNKAANKKSQLVKFVNNL